MYATFLSWHSLSETTSNTWAQCVPVASEYLSAGKRLFPTVPDCSLDSSDRGFNVWLRRSPFLELDHNLILHIGKNRFNVYLAWQYKIHHIVWVVQFVNAKLVGERYSLRPNILSEMLKQSITTHWWCLEPLGANNPTSHQWSLPLFGFLFKRSWGQKGILHRSVW